MESGYVEDIDTEEGATELGYAEDIDTEEGATELGYVEDIETEDDVCLVIDSEFAEGGRPESFELLDKGTVVAVLAELSELAEFKGSLRLQISGTLKKGFLGEVVTNASGLIIGFATTDLVSLCFLAGVLVIDEGGGLLAALGTRGAFGRAISAYDGVLLAERGSRDSELEDDCLE